jgi:hypothetical protein
LKKPKPGWMPLIDETLITEPPPALAMYRAAICVPSMTP